MAVITAPAAFEAARSQ